MFKVTYSFWEGSPAGGDWKIVQEIKVYDANTAKELNEAIEEFVHGSSYRKGVMVDDIKRL